MLLPTVDELSSFRPDLIERISAGVMKSLLSRLVSHQPPVLNSTEAEDILQMSRVRQDQVTFLIDVVINKGDKACDTMLFLLRELDPYLCDHLGL